MNKLFDYECNQCNKACTLCINSPIDEVEDTISGYDYEKDCDYYFILKGEHKQ